MTNQYKTRMASKYDEIGTNYNLTRRADNYLLEQFELLLNIKDGQTILDIGCGTGNYTIALYRETINLIGIDPSIEMLSIAKKRNSKVNWLLGSVDNISLNNVSVDKVFGSMTIHHWSSLNNGFSEIYRILKSKGSMVILTSTAEQMKHYWLNHYFPKMMKDAITQMPTLSQIESSLLKTGFTLGENIIYNVKRDLKDKFLYSGKNNPKIYLDTSVRNGISSFASLSYKSEVETGLLKLEADINSKDINNIIQSYNNSLGDYLFIKAEKING